MIIDKGTEVIDAVVAATAAVSSSYDTGASGDAGPGTPLYVNIESTTATFGGTETGVIFEVIGATNAALSTGIKVLARIYTSLAATAITVGLSWQGGPISQAKGVGRYLGIRITGASAGSITTGGYKARFALAPLDANINNPI